MGAIAPSALYAEFRDDPRGYGYRVGLGVPFSEKQDMINETRATIEITRKAEDTAIGPGEVAESIPVQLIRDAIDPDEYKANCVALPGSDPDQEQKRDTGLRILNFYGGSDGQSQFAFTTLSKGQILDLFMAADWPTTRQNLIDLQTREGSRAEELFGNPDAPVTRQDMLDAEAWRVENEPQSGSLYS